MFAGLKNILKSEKPEGTIPGEKDSLLVDVRTISEFNAGHHNESINIPLNAITNHIKDFKDSGKTIILICRSGARSGQAAKMLRAQGIDAYNGGPWDSFRYTD